MRVILSPRLLGLLTAAWLIFSSLTINAATPELDVTRDISGAKITWNASDGQDYILEGSKDFATWTQVRQSIVKEGDLHRVFVPESEELNFFRLVDDGVRKQAAYVGSETCKTCHATKYSQFIDSGHGYKMNEVINGQPPTYFSDDQVNVPNTPEGVSWNDVSYVIGGALWKGRFVDKNGYIMTGSAVQYNLANHAWSAYEAAVPNGTKAYDCGACHTTGWVSLQDGGVHQQGMAGFKGSFAAPGIQCEACHGPGGRHAASLGNKAEIVKDTSAELCGKCHIRGAANTIPAKAGYIEHHEQYNEMLSAGHKIHSCNTCHDPHISTVRQMAGSITKACTDCHSTEKYAQDFHNTITACTTCHMPEVTKSAVAKNKYTADIRTHIFKINTAADGQMFTADGKFANGTTGVTLAYVCYQCHKDADGVGGTRSTRTLEQLSAKATGFHN